MSNETTAPTAVRFVTARKVNYRVTGTVDMKARKVIVRLDREEENWRTQEMGWVNIYTGTPKCLVDAVAEVKAELAPLVPVAPVGELNAGTCMICGGPFKLDRSGNLVLHGYKRPGVGYIIGDCWATGMQPWEKSPAQLHKYRPAVVAHLEKARAYLAALQADKVESFSRMVSDYSKPRRADWTRPQMLVTAKRGDAEKRQHRDGYDMPSFDSIRQMELHNADRDVTDTVAELARVDHLLANWAEAPLIHKP